MRVCMIAASTICGRISPGTMGSSEDRSLLERLRMDTDASLLGAATLREGDPEMRGPDGALIPERLRAVISRSGNVPVLNKKLFSLGPKPIVFTGAEQREALCLSLGARAEVVALPTAEQGVSIVAALGELRRRGAQSVLIEGGGRLNYTCLAQGVVDEIFLTITPYVSGDRHAASLADGPEPLGTPFIGLDLLSCERSGSGELFCRYKIQKHGKDNE